MKYLILIIVLLSILSCSDAIKSTYYKGFYIRSYGDERFHDCKDLIDVIYGIEIDGDTVEIGQTHRPCPADNTRGILYDL
jgi:hypothetical protein